ncbi:hypothetical protein CK203_001277 [Vitis vinifera]|uniref:Uncharacterized protein n=1 Tax=Vitis vinifera TaxID=29760 RepID=A0A438KLF0_VITVI|nr:hypothetical protein CK203_001277 [Vitis vinifera]
MAPKKTVSSARVSEAGEKAIDKLDVKDSGSGTIQRGAPVPSAGVVQGIPPLLSDSTHLHSSQPCPGADGMQHHQHAVQPRPYATGSVLCLFPEESKNDIFSVSAPALPSNGDRAARFDKGRGEGAGGGRGGWAGLSQRASRPFSPNYTLKIPGLELRGHLVDWVEKASFACVCKLFEIDPKERAYKTLLSARNLIAVVREPQEYLKRLMLKRRKLLEDRDQKKTEGTIRKAPGQKRAPRTHVGVESFGPSLAAAARLANVAEEAASINRPGNLNPDADAAETAPLEEAGAESQSQPSDDPDRLAIVLVKGPPQRSRVRRAIYGPDSWRLQERQQEIELAALLPMTLIRMEARWRWQLRPQPPRMIYVFAFLVCVSAGEGPPRHAQQHDLFTQLLQTADYMRTFSSRRQEIENQLRLRMEEAEAIYPPCERKMKPSEWSWLRRRVEKNQLRAAYMRRKKEDLQLRLDVQKEELEREFAVEREELAADYQQQVDDTFIFGYRCCMKKNGISEIPLQFLRVKKRSSMRSPLPDSLSLFAIFLL